MRQKIITLRKISTGGTIIIMARNATDIIKTKNLDPSDWEEVKGEPESEDDGSTERPPPAGDENN